MVVRRAVVIDLELVVIEGAPITWVVHNDAVTTGARLLRLLFLQVLALGLLVRVWAGLVVIAISVNSGRRMVNRRELLSALVKEVQIEDVMVVVDIVMMVS